MRVLLTNDDGIDAPGLVHLRAALLELDAIDAVDVVAPASVQSAMSHAVTFHRPIRVSSRVVDRAGCEAFEGWAVEGRPADCVKLALAHLCPEVDLVISGMNSGANVGVNVLYSGTVAAAREAAFVGVPAIAASLHIGDWEAIRWAAAARQAAGCIARILESGRPGPCDAIRPHGFLNLNVPILDPTDDDPTPQPRGVKVVPIADSPLVDAYEARPQDDGSTLFTVNSSMAFRAHPEGSDVYWLFERYTTVSPMLFDSHDRDQLEHWAGVFEDCPTGPIAADTDATANADINATMRS